jgi:hypothetical protein
MDNTNKGLNNIKKIYENLTYFDQYGSSLILFIIITIILIIFIFSCIALANIQPIQQDWPNQRCKPYIIPIAGFINKPPNVNFSDYTAQNFNYCTQNILKDITGIALEPITFITKSLSTVTNDAKQATNDIRGMVNKIRTLFASIIEEIMGRILNITIPLQQIIISFKDFAAKIQGTMTAGLFTTLGAFLTLKSFLGVIAKFIVTILITLAVLIAVFWIFPFTWGTAIASTSIFVAIAIPMAIILTFMTNVLGINSGLKIPSVKCFDKNTQFVMNDGTTRNICEIQVGEKLNNNTLITSKIVVESKGSIMYNLNGVIVSDSHMVNCDNKWIRVDEHPHSIRIENYPEPFLYCINTDDKIIKLNNIVFSDWDEIYGEELEKIKHIKLKNIKYNCNKNINISEKEMIINNLDIHKYLNGGFHKNTEIKLKNGYVKKIKNISIGDVLENGEKVYGYVEIDGNNLIEQAVYNLGKNKFIEGGVNLNLCDKNKGFTSTLELEDTSKKIKCAQEFEDKLYHLLTDTKTFYINGINFYDYNSSIDLFLEKYRGKLLSMKYV